jgi:hypothetical protein
MSARCRIQELSCRLTPESLTSSSCMHHRMLARIVYSMDIIEWRSKVESHIILTCLVGYFSRRSEEAPSANAMPTHAANYRLHLLWYMGRSLDYTPSGT